MDGSAREKLRSCLNQELRLIEMLRLHEEQFRHSLGCEAADRFLFLLEKEIEDHERVANKIRRLLYELP